MTHAEFMLFVARRKASIIHALVRGALPPGAHFAVFIQLGESDDPQEEPLTAAVADLDRAGIAALVTQWRGFNERAPRG